MKFPKIFSSTNSGEVAWNKDYFYEGVLQQKWWLEI